MQTFKQKQIALAVGTALMVMAGAAQAAAPALRATAPAVVIANGAGASGTVAGDAAIRSLLSATGLSGQSVTFSVALTSAVTTAGITGDVQATAGNALGAVTTTLITGNPTLTVNNVNVYTGTLSAATALPVASAALGPDLTPTGSTGTAAVGVVLSAPVAPAAYRVNAGNLEYTSNNGTTGGTAVAFAPVNVNVQSAVAGGVTANDVYIYTEVNAAAGYTAAADLPITVLTVTGTIKNALAPTPTIATRSTAGAALIDGVVVDTGTPVTVAALPAVTNLKVVTTANAPVVAATDITAKMASSAVGNTQVLTFTTPATTIGWVSGLTTATAADNAAYASTAFNTGVNLATVPVSVDGTATASAYTQVVNALDGSAAKLDDSAGTSKAVTAAALTAATVAQACVAAQGAALTAAGTGVAANAAAEDALVQAIVAPVLNTPAACSTAAAVTAGVAADTAVKAASTAAAAAGGATAATVEVAVEASIVAQNVTQDAAVVTATAADAAFPATFAAPGGNIITDAAAPVLVSAATNATSHTLALVFSEPMDIATSGAQALREVAENVLVGTDSLAALNLNNGGTLTISGTGVAAGATGSITPSAAGQSTLVITDASTALATYAAGKAITVNTGIFFGETNDGTGATVTTTQDPLGSLASSSGAVEGASGTKTSAAAVLDAMFDGTNGVLTTARASTGADATKVATIKVTFPAAGAVAFAATKTVANLVGQIVVRVNGTGVGNAPIVWDFYPSAAQMTLTNSTTLDITIPTPLLYSNVPSLISMNLMYLNNPGGGILGPNVLVAAASATDVIDASTGGITVTIPFAATAKTNNLLTQSIIGSLTSAAAVNGDLVEAYVAKWVDAPATTGVSVTGITGTIGAQAISFNSAAGLVTLINAEQAKIAAAQAAVPGVSAAVAAGVAANIPVYVVMTGAVPTLYNTAAAAAIAQTTLDDIIKTAAATAATAGSRATGADMGTASNNNSGSYNNAGSLNSSMNAGVVAALGSIANSALAGAIPDAILQAANTAAAAPGATVSSVVSALLKAGVGPSAIKTAVLNPVTGAITGGVTGVITMTKSAGTVATRGLVFMNTAGAQFTTSNAAGTWASGVVGTVNGAANSYDLLLGIEPATADLVLKKNPNWFVLLVHVPATVATPADLNMLTSADPLATNFMSFTPNLISGLGTRTTLATNLAKLTKLVPAASTNWALYGLGNPAVNAAAPVGQVASFPRRFVGIEAVNGTPATFWTSDNTLTGNVDMAMTMKSNAVAVATELGDLKDTLSTISNASFVPGAAALAWKNDAAGAAGEHIDVLQAATAPAAGSIKVGTGWSLVTVPTGMAAAVPAAVGAIIKVGAQVSSGYTWIKATDAATTPVPALTAGEAVFVYSAAGGAIN